MANQRLGQQPAHIRRTTCRVLTTCTIPLLMARPGNQLRRAVRCTGVNGERRELGPYVTVLFGAAQGKYPDGNTVVVQGHERSVVIDPSLGSRERGLSADMIVLTHTHEDHAAGISAVEHSSLHVHHDDLAALRSVDGLLALYGLPDERRADMVEFVTEGFHFEGWPQAQGFADGDVFDLGGVTITVRHAPGHTAGHSVLVIEADDAPTVAVTGDIDLSSFGPYYGDAASSLEDFDRTLATLRDLTADHYVTFHHKGVIDGVDAWVAAVDAFAAVIGRREQALLNLLDAPKTLDELVAVGIVYRPGTAPAVFGESVERRSISQHLDRLIAAERVVETGGVFAVR
jgi:glyoxylase-like metal-dependent hydrolase (beta-lactamase superfamily II)